MRRAEWRRRADHPKSLLGWWWRGIVEQDRFFGIQAFALLSTVVLWFRGTPWAMMPIGIVWPIGACLRRLKPPDRLSELLSQPSPADQFRAFVAYRWDGIATGTDEMALCVVDGWLVAEGVRSSFSLRVEDVLRLRTGSDRTGRLSLSDGSEIVLTGINDEARTTLERWHARSPTPKGVPTLPPRKVHPQEIARWSAWLMASLIPFPLAIVGRFLWVGAEWRMAVLLVGGAVWLLTSQMAYRKFHALIVANTRAKEMESQDALAGQALPHQVASEEAKVRIG